MTKDEVRRAVAQLQRGMSRECMMRSSALAQQRFVESETFTRATSLGCYLSWGREIGTEHIMAEALAAGKILAAPKFFSEEKVWRHCRLREAAAVVKSDWGVPEPQSGEIIERDELDVIVVPGLAFDGSGQRIGRGNGHYDALLRGFSGTLVGLAFAFQVYDGLPVEAHDVPMDFLVTPERVIACRP